MAAVNKDSATGKEAGGITRSVKDYCDQAVTNFKAGRHKEAHLFANEALELDKENAKAAALYRHVLYALHPTKRLLDKAKALCEEADRCKKAGDHDKALELLSLAKKWHCTPGILYVRASVNELRRRWDLAYVNMSEGLKGSKEGKLQFAAGQHRNLTLLGYYMLPPMDLNLHPQPDEMPSCYHVDNWPKELRIESLGIFVAEGYVSAIKTDRTVLKPHIPLNQLALFLNNHVQGAVQKLVLMGQDARQDVVPRLLDEVTVPRRLHVGAVNFTDFFRLPWADIKRILDGRTLRAIVLDFLRLQLPSGVDANEFLKLPTVRGCGRLHFSLYNRFAPQIPWPPLFENAALLEWIKGGDCRSLQLTRDYLSSGLLSFLDALKKDFLQANRVHSYEVRIDCPHVNVVAGLGVENEVLGNRLGEKMQIGVGEDRVATVMMEHRFETVFVKRSS